MISKIREAAGPRLQRQPCQLEIQTDDPPSDPLVAPEGLPGIHQEPRQDLPHRLLLTIKGVVARRDYMQRSDEVFCLNHGSPILTRRAPGRERRMMRRDRRERGGASR